MDRFEEMGIAGARPIAVAEEVNRINCTLGQIVQKDKKLRSKDRDNTQKIKELTARNSMLCDGLFSATQRAKETERLRQRDNVVMCGFLVALAAYVIYVSF